MDLRQLRAAVAVAEHLHFGRAATALGVAQPPLSQAIRALERELGVALFTRDTRHVALTPAGAEFVTEARTALSIVDQARTRAQAAGRGETGTLAIGMVGSTLDRPILDILRAYRRQYPDVRLSFSELTTADQVERLRARSLDVGFLRPPLPAPGNEELTLTTVAREALLAVLPAHHRLAGRRRISLTALADEPFVRTPRPLGAGLHDTISAVCREAGFEPRVVQEAVRMQSIVGLVAAGYGVSIVPVSVASSAPTDQVVFVQLSPAPSPVELALAHPRRHDSPTIEAFAALAHDLTRAPARTRDAHSGQREDDAP